jgi:hypothetical protein
MIHTLRMGIPLQNRTHRKSTTRITSLSFRFSGESLSLALSYFYVVSIADCRVIIGRKWGTVGGKRGREREERPNISSLLFLISLSLSLDPVSSVFSIPATCLIALTLHVCVSCDNRKKKRSKERSKEEQIGEH